MLPSLDEQQLTGTRGSLYNACMFSARNYVAGDYLEFGVWSSEFGGETHSPGPFIRLRSPGRITWLGWRDVQARQREIPAPSVLFGKSGTSGSWRSIRLKACQSQPAQREIAEEWVKGEFSVSVRGSPID